ncbi:MAG: DUF790 family protein [Victivallales bacterium]|nr:DUF790 family protein [Victivallales bacterium]
MLTKDLVKFRKQGKYVRPNFIATNDSSLLRIAEDLLTIYHGQEEGENLTRGEIEELVEPVLKSHRDLKLTRGLNKLVLDRCDFSQAEDFDYPSLRRQIFLKAADLIKKGAEDYAEYHKRLIDEAEIKDFVTHDIFADLPENETLTKFKEVFPRELLERYNCAQVQGLLFHASEIEVKVASPDPAELRRLFKYLKFFRLLAEIKQVKSPVGEKNIIVMNLKISGPASILENSRKYGLQLAVFFPAVCALPKWQLKADVKLSNKIYRLNLDETSNLVSHYRNFTAYIPEEIIIFHRLFKEKIEDWKISGETPFIKTKKDEIVFPDLNFQNKKGKIIHLELFHRWHRGALLKRLEFCEVNPDLPLLLGVDRALLKGDLRQLLENSTYFQQKGFLFRDFPGVARVNKLLNENSKKAN